MFELKRKKEEPPMKPFAGEYWTEIENIIIPNTIVKVIDTCLNRVAYKYVEIKGQRIPDSDFYEMELDIFMSHFEYLGISLPGNRRTNENSYFHKEFHSKTLL